MMAKLNVPFISHASAGVFDYSRYATMTRVTYQVANGARSVYYILERYNWTQIALIVDANFVVNMGPHVKLYSGKWNTLLIYIRFRHGNSHKHD